MKYTFNLDLPHYLICTLKGKQDEVVKNVRQATFGSKNRFIVQSIRISELERLNNGFDEEENGECRFSLKVPLHKPDSLYNLFTWIKQITNRDVSHYTDYGLQKTTNIVTQNGIHNKWVFEDIESYALYTYYYAEDLINGVIDIVNRKEVKLEFEDVIPANHHFWIEEKQNSFFEEQLSEIKKIENEIKYNILLYKNYSQNLDKKERIQQRIRLIIKQVSLMRSRYTGETQNIDVRSLLTSLSSMIKSGYKPVFADDERLQLVKRDTGLRGIIEGIKIGSSFFPGSDYCFLFNDNYVFFGKNDSVMSHASDFPYIANSDMKELWILAKKYTALRSSYLSLKIQPLDSEEGKSQPEQSYCSIL